MAANDTSGGTTAPANRAFAVTPADGSDFAVAARAIWVGGAGDVKLTTFGGDTVTLVGVTAGCLIPVRVSRVFSTGTTATSIVGLY